jgi:glycosyltransferase involved in cell wall biosynthesis
MKILLVSLHLVEYAVELANGLGKKNDVHLLLLRNRVSKTIGNRMNKQIANNTSFTLLPFHSIMHPSTLRIFLSVFYLFIRFRPDVVHIQENSNPLNLFFLLFRLKPIVVTVHDVYLHPGEQASSTPSWKMWFSHKIRRYGYPKIIVHGEKLKEEFIERYQRSPQDVFVVPHGCLFSFLSERSNGISEEPHTALFFGRIQQYKGLKYLIEAEPLVTQKYPDFRVIVGGKGDDIDAHHSALSSNPHFEVHNRFIPNEEVHSFFERSSFVVLPYVEASQSGIVAMAFAFGKPVIVTNVGSLTEVVQDGESGLIVPPRDSKELADAIIYLLENGDIRKGMGKEALRLAKTTLSWEHIAHLTEKVYQELITPG